MVADGLDWQMPADPIYRIYSMTKPIVSMMGALLMERCQLNLFTPLRAILPEFAKLEVLRADGTREKALPITIEQLFTHRAGFSYNFIPDCPVSELYHADGLMNDGSCSLEEFAHRAAKFPLASQPGERWHYSIATDILARVIEVVAGRPLGDLLQAEIFDPLNMTDTQFFVAESERHRLMPMYGRSLDDILKAPDAAAPLKKIDVDDAYPFDRPDTFARGGHGLFFNHIGLHALRALLYYRPNCRRRASCIAKNARLHVGEPPLGQTAALLVRTLPKPRIRL